MMTVSLTVSETEIRTCPYCGHRYWPMHPNEACPWCGR